MAGDNEAHRNEHNLMNEGSEEMRAVRGPSRALEGGHIANRQDTPIQCLEDREYCRYTHIASLEAAASIGLRSDLH
jgi:hypothetical protein